MNNAASGKKILLALLPFWNPQIPPLGLACLKSFLQKHGFNVKTVDANVEVQFRELYDQYFAIIKKNIPVKNHGNMYNIGNDVLRDHLMAALNHVNEEEYIELVKILIYQTFLTEVQDSVVAQLNGILGEFYLRLEKYFDHLLKTENPDVVGLSIYSGTLPASLLAFQLAKKFNPEIMTVMGGGIFADQLALGSPNLEFFLEKTPYIDKVIMGEGEQLLLKLLEGQLPADQRVFTLEDNQGQLLDMSTVDIPDYTDFDTNFYPYIAAYASRSCPFQCKFCAETVNWGKYRKKNVEQVIEELVRLYKNHKYQLFLSSDSLLNPIITQLAEALIKADLALYWDGFLRADKDVCDTDNTLLWRRGGFYRARLGVESGSQRVLDLMDKRITIEQTKAAVSSLAYAGIKTTTYWVIGYPGETEEDFQKTLELVEELKDDIYEADCNPYNYFITGQIMSEEWARENKSMLLYPEKARDILITQTWVINAEPSREEKYRRLYRFVEHCNRLGIPNPYSLYEISKADERWKMLHPNAVPPLTEFKNGEYFIDECKYVKNLMLAQKTQDIEEGWDF